MKYIIKPLFRTIIVLITYFVFYLDLLFIGFIKFIWYFNFSYIKEQTKKFNNNPFYERRKHDYLFYKTTLDYILSKK